MRKGRKDQRRKGRLKGKKDEKEEERKGWKNQGKRIERKNKVWQGEKETNTDGKDVKIYELECNLTYFYIH